ncbi:ester cyclase [Rhodococcus xishaensis]|uniref:SnoaL-like polyketide cyclase n=1 Tax=Rhodococcus xishaensis TaxID=2487364 RepID=A0A438AYW2_9NOCA|nr:ester cyclase [Rhodococcus xishaensis]RVW03862.1 hypothetical protein EGT50_04935 [Rhodococcus xishaensis]
MATDHKSTSKYLLELWGDNTPHKPDDYLAANYVNHQLPDVSGGTSTKSLAEWHALLDEFHKSFSDVDLEVMGQVQEGDFVCSFFRLTGKQTDLFQGIAATGNTSSWTGVHTDRYEDGKLVESWVNWDKYSFLEGLGLAPN